MIHLRRAVAPNFGCGVLIESANDGINSRKHSPVLRVKGQGNSNFCLWNISHCHTVPIKGTTQGILAKQTGFFLNQGSWCNSATELNNLKATLSQDFYIIQENESTCHWGHFNWVFFTSRILTDTTRCVIIKLHHIGGNWGPSNSQGEKIKEEPRGTGRKMVQRIQHWMLGQLMTSKF